MPTPRRRPPGRCPRTPRCSPGRFPSVHQAHDEQGEDEGARRPAADRRGVVPQRTATRPAASRQNPHISNTHGLDPRIRLLRQGPTRAADEALISLVLCGHRLIDRLGFGWATDKGGAMVVGGTSRGVGARASGRTGRPTFVFVNFLEAHFPYHQLPHDMPRPLHGPPAARSCAAISLDILGAAVRRADRRRWRAVHRAVARDLYDGGIAYTDALLAPRRRRRCARAARSTAPMLVVLADHGELLGERGGFFGHGPSLYQPHGPRAAARALLRRASRAARACERRSRRSACSRRSSTSRASSRRRRSRRARSALGRATAGAARPDPLRGRVATRSASAREPRRPADAAAASTCAPIAPAAGSSSRRTNGRPVPLRPRARSRRGARPRARAARAAWRGWPPSSKRARVRLELPRLDAIGARAARRARRSTRRRSSACASSATWSGRRAGCAGRPASTPTSDDIDPARGLDRRGLRPRRRGDRPVARDATRDGAPDGPGPSCSRRMHCCWSRSEWRWGCSVRRC